jgi:anti-sigma B factor antagonist
MPAKLTGWKRYVSFYFHAETEESMKFSSRQVGSVVVLDIEGKILLGDGDTEIKQAVDGLLSQGRRKILLNLAKVPYIDSAGLGEVIRCFTALRKNGGDLKLLAPNQRLVDLLNVTKLVNVFDWYGDEPSAVASFKS